MEASLGQRTFHMLYNWLDVPAGQGTWQQFLLALKMRIACRVRALPQFEAIKEQFQSRPQWALVELVWTNAQHKEFWVPVENEQEFRRKYADVVMGIRWKTEEPVQLEIYYYSLGPSFYRGLRIVTKPFELQYPYNAGFGTAFLPFELRSPIPEGLEIKWGYSPDWRAHNDHQVKFVSTLDQINQTADQENKS
jgi:hypothetical protein